MIFNQEKVLEYLPHREPFLFVNSIESLSLPDESILKQETVKMKDILGAKVVGLYTPPLNHPIFAGHFPGNPIFPGVLQVEMMAQVSCFITTYCIKGDFSQVSLDVALVSVDKSRFRKPLLPDMKLRIEVELKKVRGNFLSFYSEVLNGDEVISQCEFMAVCQILEKE